MALSVSEANSYVRCPQAWAFRYQRKIKLAAPWAIVGRAAHAAEATNAKQKIRSHRDLPAGQVRDLVVKAFERECQTEEVIWGDEDREGALDRALRAAEAHHAGLAPDIHPAAVEKRFSLPLPNGREVIGRIDLIDEQGDIHETKHVSDEPRPGGPFETQPPLYALAQRQVTGRMPSVVLDYVILGRPSAHPRAAVTHSVRVLPETVTPRVPLVLYRLSEADRAMRAGIVFGVADARICSSCAYRVICPWISQAP